MKNNNLRWHHNKISIKDREQLIHQKGLLIWFTGLSGSGKSTIASALEEALFHKGKLCYLLDGDNIRHGLNSDLDFSIKDRKENIRRVAEVANLMVDANLIVITSFISPLIDDRENVRKMFGKYFIEVFVDCPLNICEMRDVKGLYKKARNNEIKNFTGISSPYEKPINPEIVLNSEKNSIETLVEQILNFMSINKFI